MLAIDIVFWMSLLVPVYVYFGYPLLLACCHLFCRSDASRAHEAWLPTVSLILAAHNEEPHVRRKLENCLALDYPHDRLDILIGSDGSEDGTNGIIERYRDARIRFFAYSPRRGKMATVNRLVRKAKGEICMFSDISEVFDGDAVQKLVRHFADPDVGAVTGNHIYNSKTTGLGFGTSLYWRLQRFLQRIESRISTVCTCDGTIYACRRNSFPFPPDNTINDDMAVPLGIITKGKRVIFDPEAVARGDVLPETKRFFHQKVRGQAGRCQVFTFYPQMFWPWPLSRWWVFLSRSVFPVLVPWALVVAFVSSGLLCLTGSWVYRLLFLAQSAFYTLALFGWIAEQLEIYLSVASIPFYFVTANVGSVVGFWSFLTGRQGTAWRKVE